ncbi:hypothetical protein OROHE_001368 [Orobanche hederae]
MVFVVFLLALILSTNPVESTDCLSVGANILQCRNYLQNPESVIMQPEDQCCHAANNIVDARNNNINGDDNTDSLCECLRQNPLASGFLPSKAQQLPILCNLAGFSPLVNCLRPIFRDVSHQEHYSIPATDPGSVSATNSISTSDPIPSAVDSISTTNSNSPSGNSGCSPHGGMIPSWRHQPGEREWNMTGMEYDREDNTCYAMVSLIAILL